MPLTISNHLPALATLPRTFLVELSQYSAIKMAGEDQSKYLQGQVTCDVNSLEEQGILVGAHCDAKGKVFSIFRLINRLSEHLLIQTKSSLNASLAELKKFGVFAKVDIIATENLAFYALVGENATHLIQQKFSSVPDSLTPVVQCGSTTIVYIACDENASIQHRYIVIDEQGDGFTNILTSFDVPVFGAPIWDLLEITQGFPQLSNKSSGQYVPQMLNLQAIKGISFTKGCYLGQETVARMQYLGKNKRALFSLKGKVSKPLSADDIIEKQLGENWRKAGDILSSYQSDDSECYLQAVLSSDLYDDAEASTLLRIKSQPECLLTISTLPYSLSKNSD